MVRFVREADVGMENLCSLETDRNLYVADTH